MIQIEILLKNSIVEVESDYLLLKNTSEGNFGPEQSIDRVLGGFISSQKNEMIYKIGRTQIYNGLKGIAAGGIILIDIGEGFNMRYNSIELMCDKAIEIISINDKEAKSIATVSHGVGFGLDQKEVFYSQIFSFKNALEKFKTNIERIYFNEISQGEANKLLVYLNEFKAKYPNIIKHINGQFFLNIDNNSTIAENYLKEASLSSLAFIAMPFKEEFENTYDFGIRQAVEAAKLKPLRTDKEYFTGSIMNELEKRIKESVIIIADISGLNINVVYELGYAEGIGKPVIIICKKGENLPFDLSGKNVIFYNPNILRELQEKLIKMIENIH